MTIEGAYQSGINGLNAFSYNLSNISDSLANVDTTGYKRTDTDFRDFLSGPSIGYPQPLSVRAGAAIRTDLQGAVVHNDNPTSFAVKNGDGFIRVGTLTTSSDGTVQPDFTNGRDPGGVGPGLFTRNGDFSLDANGYLVNSAGYVLAGVPESTTYGGDFPTEPTEGTYGADVQAVRVTPGVYDTCPPVTGSTTAGKFKSASIYTNGYVNFTYDNGTVLSPYRVPLTKFTNPDALDEVNGAAFKIGDTVTRSDLWAGGAAGEIQSSSAEQSNVDIGTEMTQMIVAQRAYSASSKTISTADQMIQTAINVKA